MSNMLSENEDQIRKELLKLMKHFECPICLNLMSDPMITRCVHRFCGQCITKSIDSSVSEWCRCPLCNEKISKRALRPQTELSDLINALKSAVDSFERDHQMSIITDADDVVVFDVSTADKSQSLAQINDTTDGCNESIGAEVEDNCVEPQEEPINVSNEVELNRKTSITVVSDDWPTCETIEDLNADMNETDVYFESSKNSLNVRTDESLEEMETNCVKTANPTQSQNLTVNKSKITYSSSRKPTNDRFDRIIGLSNYEKNTNNTNEDIESKSNEKHEEIKAKPIVSKEYMSSESESEVESIGSESTSNRRKPLIQKIQNQKLDPKKKFKRIQTIYSSDDEFSSPLVVSTKRKVPQMRGSDAFEDKSNQKSDIELSDEDLFLPKINDKTLSFESNRCEDSANESKNGYNSDTQLITSSPLNSEF